MQKKQALWIFGVGTSIFLLLLIVLVNNGGGIYRDLLKNIFLITALLFFTFPIAFVFSFITYKMRDEIFRTWIRFSYWWIPMSVLFTVLMLPARSGGSFGVPSFGVGGIAMFFAVLYVIISTILILYKSIKFRGK